MDVDEGVTIGGRGQSGRQVSSLAGDRGGGIWFFWGRSG